MRLARWKVENHSDTYSFIWCPSIFFFFVCGGRDEGEGLQCAQLGDEVNKYSNLEEFS